VLLFLLIIVTAAQLAYYEIHFNNVIVYSVKML